MTDAEDPDAKAARLVRLGRWNDMTDEIETIIRKYGEIILSEDEVEGWDGDYDPPDWTNPLALTDWSLVIGVADVDPDATKRGYWVLHIEPWHQLPYRTRGLLESRLDEL